MDIIQFIVLQFSAGIIVIVRQAVDNLGGGPLRRSFHKSGYLIFKEDTFKEQFE
jgi:hypothetical protein